MLSAQWDMQTLIRSQFQKQKFQQANNNTNRFDFDRLER